jgi:ACR3 family arsenite transporter
MYGLLFTVVVLFALQGNTTTSEPLTVARTGLPLLAYFAIMWFGGFAISRYLRDLPSYHRAGLLRRQ